MLFFYFFVNVCIEGYYYNNNTQYFFYTQCYNISEILGQVSGHVSTTEVSREQLAHLSVLLIYYVGHIDSKCGTKVDATNTTVAAAHAYMTNMTATPHGIGDFLNSVKVSHNKLLVITLWYFLIHLTNTIFLVIWLPVSCLLSDTLLSVVNDTLVMVVAHLSVLLHTCQCCC